ncbi:S1/P1 nuclease [Sphingomonas yunnanensis]|uniref:S1/P1 nuclease n=1 Tax=Sphingomonas yunnanensis TaxID=310400 RepID=UPI001CA6D041|nr:S1/P1 nuclease [Sphingomonas yunnanensis]MBY9063211.1 S1/P1 nuclease [Sphingomonas yunnanensis]
MPALPSRVLVALLAALAAILPAPALAWGKTGHRVVAQVADARLTPRARRAVKAILGVETLAEAANWPDTMKSDPSPFWQRQASPWHYVTVPTGKSYAEVGAPPEGDAVTALTRFRATLSDGHAPLAERQAALRFVVHLVGDLHQPLHTGNGTDRGGNDRKVTFFGRATNLHTVWDSGLVDDEQLSFTELSTWLGARITRAEARDWAATDPRVWIAESAALRDRIYPAAGQDALSYAYVYENTPRMELQLEKGGVRLAAYLNQLFAQRRR